MKYYTKLMNSYYVYVLTLSSLRQAKRYPANLLSFESRVCTTPDKGSNDVLLTKLIKDHCFLYKSTKYPRSLCSLNSLIYDLEIKCSKKSNPFSFFAINS